MNKKQYFPIRSIFLMVVCLFVACEDDEEVEALKQIKEEVEVIQPHYRDAFLGDYKFHILSHSLSQNIMNPTYGVSEGDYDGSITASGTEEIAIDISGLSIVFGETPTYITTVSPEGTLANQYPQGGVVSFSRGFFRNDSIYFHIGRCCSNSIYWWEVSGAKSDHKIIDEEEPQQDNSGLTMDCRPTSYKFALDSATYSYNVSNQVSKISIYWNGTITLKQEVTFEYNAEGQLVHVQRVYVQGGYKPDDYELIYDGQQKPQKIHRSGEISPTYFLYYDEEGRLIRRANTAMDGTEYSYTRYEYGDDSNVLRAFSKSDTNLPEYLTDNFVFDSKPRFYKDHPELEIFYISILGGNTPGKNNILSYDLSYMAPPEKINNNVAYNSIGLIKKFGNYTNSSTYEFRFFEMAYECH